MKAWGNKANNPHGTILHRNGELHSSILIHTHAKCTHYKSHFKWTENGSLYHIDCNSGQITHKLQEALYRE